MAGVHGWWSVVDAFSLQWLRCSLQPSVVDAFSLQWLVVSAFSLQWLMCSPVDGVQWFMVSACNIQWLMVSADGQCLQWLVVDG